MKTLLITAALLMSTSVFAADTVTTGCAPGSTTCAAANSISSSGSEASNQGNSQQITFTSPPTQTQTQIIQGGTESTMHQTFGTQTIKNTPSVSGSPLTSSNDTCMGSASGSANVPGIGLSFGKTYTDDNCVMLKNSRELWNMGMKAASMALMCMDKNNRDALEITGYVCPQSARTQASAKAGEPTDPYIRARMGLPALKE